MNNQEQYTAYLFILMDIGHLWVVEALQHLNLIFVRFLFQRFPEEFLCGRSRPFLGRCCWVIMRRHWKGVVRWIVVLFASLFPSAASSFLMFSRSKCGGITIRETFLRPPTLSIILSVHDRLAPLSLPYWLDVDKSRKGHSLQRECFRESSCDNLIAIKGTTSKSHSHTHQTKQKELYCSCSTRIIITDERTDTDGWFDTGATEQVQGNWWLAYFYKLESRKTLPVDVYSIKCVTVLRKRHRSSN